MITERKEQLRAVEQLWESLGDVPIDENECIELWFLSFPPGTDREDIWHWFEDSLGVSVVYLMGNKVDPWVTGQ